MRLLSALLLAVTIYGCSPDEPLINSFDDSWRYLATVPGGVASIRMPAGTIDNPSVWSGDGTYPVHDLAEFRDQFFLLTTDERIVVLDRETLLASDTITTTGLGSPSGIAFANATTAYATFPQATVVGVIDLTVGAVVSEIPIEGTPVDIDAVGNQLCVAVQGADEAVIIDSRTNSVEARITLPSANPAYVQGISTTSLFAVATLGAGKVADDDRERTTPTLSYISIADRDDRQLCGSDQS